MGPFVLPRFVPFHLNHAVFFVCSCPCPTARWRLLGLCPCYHSTLNTLCLARLAWTEWHFLEDCAVITGHFSSQPGMLDQGILRSGASKTELWLSKWLLVGSFLCLSLKPRTVLGSSPPPPPPLPPHEKSRWEDRLETQRGHGLQAVIREATKTYLGLPLRVQVGEWDE